MFWRETGSINRQPSCLEVETLLTTTRALLVLSSEYIGSQNNREEPEPEYRCLSHTPGTAGCFQASDQINELQARS